MVKLCVTQCSNLILTQFHSNRQHLKKEVLQKGLGTTGFVEHTETEPTEICITVSRCEREPYLFHGSTLCSTEPPCPHALCCTVLVCPVW